MLFRKPHTLKGRAAFVPGIWLGKDTESDQHFVADASGVFKTRSVKRHPPSRQADVAVLQSISARPWDPTGSKAETDTFVFPAKRSEEATALDPSNFGEEQQQQASEPLAPGDWKSSNFLETTLTTRQLKQSLRETTFRIGSL